MKLAIFAIALTLAGSALAHSPLPAGMRGMLAEPPTTVEKECDDDGDPKCEKRTYTVTFNVNEKFVRMPLSQQTPKIVALKTWVAEDFADKPNVSLVLHAALNQRVIGWADGTEWVWDAGYVAELNRRAVRGGK